MRGHSLTSGSWLTVFLRRSSCPEHYFCLRCPRFSIIFHNSRRLTRSTPTSSPRTRPLRRLTSNQMLLLQESSGGVLCLKITAKTKKYSVGTGLLVQSVEKKQVVFGLCAVDLGELSEGKRKGKCATVRRCRPSWLSHNTYHALSNIRVVFRVFLACFGDSGKVALARTSVYICT